MTEDAGGSWGATERDRLWQDVRFALRSFRKSPHFTLAVILSLALGISGTCAFFSLIYAVVIHPMYRDVDRIIVPTVGQPDTDGRREPLYYTMADFLGFNKGLNAFESVIATTSRTAITQEASPRNASVLSVSPNYFDFFNTPAILGRPFLQKDVRQAQNPPPLAVIGYKFWMNEFDGDRAVIGRDLRLGPDVYKVMGVMPRAFTWFDTDVFTPLPLRPDKNRYLSAYFKLRKNMRLSAADAELQGLTQRIAKADPDHYPKPPLQMHADPFQDWVLGKLPGQLFILTAAVSMLLLIACGNVSVLLLARSNARKKEIAMRFALGATKARIVRQLLTETFVLSLSGCALSVFFAWRGLPALIAALPETSVPHESAVGLNWPVLGFAIMISLAAGLAAGLTPALSLARESVSVTIKSGDRTTGRINTQTILVTVEIALSAMLLIGCVVAIRNLRAIYQTNLGYNPHDVAVLTVALSNNRKLAWEERRAYYGRLEQALREIPGVEGVASTFNGVPPSIDFQQTFSVPGILDTKRAALALVSADYFRTLQTPLLAGRVFTPAELKQAAQVVVINESLARLLAQKGETPVGTKIQLESFKSREDELPPSQTPFFQVIGVVATVANQNLQAPSTSAIYLPYTHRLYRDTNFLVRTHGNPQLLEKALQKRLHSLVDADQPLADFDTLDHLLALSSLADAKSSATLFSLFAFVAVSLASFGLYSVLSFSVAQRTKEFAIRRALGAQSAQVASMILKWMAGVTSLGIVLGILATFLFGNLLAYYERGWKTNDPITLLAVPLMLILISTIAILPALLRAISIRPNSILQTQ